MIHAAEGHGATAEAERQMRLLSLDLSSSQRVCQKAFTLFSAGDNLIEYHRAQLRLLNKSTISTRSSSLLIGIGHYFLSGGTASFASATYQVASAMKPDDPLLALCLSVSYLRQVMNRKRPDRHAAVVRALHSLDEYARLRGGLEVSEVAYNIARAHHEIGLVHLAVPLYKRVLEMEPVTPTR